MGRKKREIIWHKRKEKFIPSSFIKPHSCTGDEEKASDSDNRKKNFAKGLSEKIRSAVQQSSKSS